LTAWLRSLIHHRPAQEGLAGLFGQVQPAGLSLAVLVVTTSLFLIAAAWLFSEREYVLDQ
jgi:ABC-type transport system involved in multi-copper enzyme maturation permease subunit